MRSYLDRLKKVIKKGDTIIEVTFAITVFSLVSVLSIQIMDRDLATIQGTLESEMARNEIDAQAEALRYIQNAYLSERELATSEREYMNLWLKLSRGTTETGGNAEAQRIGTGLANDPAKISGYTSMECDKYYSGTVTDAGEFHNIFADHAFVLNTRKVDPNNIDETIVQSNINGIAQTSKFAETELYPRVLYTKGSDPAMTTNDMDALSEIFPEPSINPTLVAQTKKVYDSVARAEGIWVISARQQEKHIGDVPEFYDFHIRTCWFAPGHDRPSTIATTIRLYNPEYIENQR